jgi:biopolymer transport protein ExbB
LGRPEQLAQGISQALLTTAGGLSVAIPSFIAYLYFIGKVDRLVIDIDSMGHELAGAIASDAWQGKPKRKSRTAGRAA